MRVRSKFVVSFALILGAAGMVRAQELPNPSPAPVKLAELVAEALVVEK